jgi:hypothetical protein
MILKQFCRAFLELSNDSKYVVINQEVTGLGQYLCKFKLSLDIGKI